MSNSSFVYIHIYMYIYVHVSMYQMAPVDVAWSDLAKHCPWSKGQLIGMGSTVPLGTVPLVWGYSRMLTLPILYLKLLYIT